MHDASGVGSVQRVGDVDGEWEKNFHFQRTTRNTVLQSQSVKKLHGDERFAMLVVDFVNRADVRMVEGRSGLRLTLESS